MPSTSSHGTPLARMYAVTGCRTQKELARFLGITQASLSDAKRRGVIPASWLIKLLDECGVLPGWIRTGQGAPFLGTMDTSQKEALRTWEAKVISNMLRSIPSVFLHEELHRREESEGWD